MTTDVYGYSCFQEVNANRIIICELPRWVSNSLLLEEFEREVEE